MRLDKCLSIAGYTRKQAKALIRAGRVSVNGATVTDPQANTPGAAVAVDGRPLDLRTHLHLMLNKPQGYITATEDARGKTVMELIPNNLRRAGLGPVGRLDKDVTGLILLTTDGQLAHRLISPRWTVEKVYRAEVRGPLDDTFIRRMEQGLPLSDFTARPAKLTILSSGKTSLCELTLTEGKYHQVKRMFAALERPVETLSRLSIAGVRLDDALKEGECRELTVAETARLYAAVALPPEEE